MISKFFIERPVLANVIAILIMVIGAVALLKLPVAQYPDVVPPTVQVTTRYPGASARTVIDTVALPIEQQVNGVEGMIYMQSYAADDGSYILTVTFKIGTDLNFAQVLVQNRVSSRVVRRCPGGAVAGRGGAEEIDVDPADRRADLARRPLRQPLSVELRHHQPEGRDFAAARRRQRHRVRRRPIRHARLARSGQDEGARPQRARRDQRRAAAEHAGHRRPDRHAAGAGHRRLSIHVQRCRPPRRPSQFANVIVKTGSTGEITRVRDIGRVELGAQTYGQIFKLDGKPAAGLAVFLAPGANALDVANEVKTRMAELARSFPQGLRYAVPFDTTVFVKASIDEVYKTLIEAAILVLIVILVFLQDWRAMLVPATTVPVTIIGAFAAMAALGFTVNFATLFAIVLAIGIVVDDAIIVVEGAAHNIDKGMNGPQAAIARHARAARADRRHHAGAAGGVPAGGVPARPHRADVCPVCAGDRRHRADQRHQRGDAEADAMRAVAAAVGAGREAQRRSTAASMPSMLDFERGYAGLMRRIGRCMPASWRCWRLSLPA